MITIRANEVQTAGRGRDLVNVFTSSFRAQTDPAPKERAPNVVWLNLRVEEEGTSANGSGGRTDTT